MPLIPFPNVADVLGVPPLPRSPRFPPVVQAAVSLIQAVIYRAFQVGNQWGIYDSKGKPLGDPSKFTGLLGGAIETLGLGATYSTDSIDYSKETRVSDFPLERGGFAQYNKVEMPANPTVTLCLSANEAARRSFLEAIDKATLSTELYSVVTPEVTYINYSVERYNYQRRSDKGATLLLVEISLKEVRQVSAAFSVSAGATKVVAPKNAAATPQVDNGRVQAKTPKPSVLKSIATKLPGLASRANEYLQGVLR
jgi:hypothetical protein